MCAGAELCQNVGPNFYWDEFCSIKMCVQRTKDALSHNSPHQTSELLQQTCTWTADGWMLYTQSKTPLPGQRSVNRHSQGTTTAA